MTRLKKQVFLLGTALAAWLGFAHLAQASAPVENYGTQPQSRNGAIAAQPGDTVESIAKLYRLPAEDIIAYNNLKPPFKLRPRQRLLLPMPRDHKVGRDDTLYSLSRMYGVAPQTIAAANHIDPPYVLHLGQMLRIPHADAAVVTKTAAAVPNKAQPAASPYNSPTVKTLELKAKHVETSGEAPGKAGEETSAQTPATSAQAVKTASPMLKAPGPSPEHVAFNSLIHKISGADAKSTHATGHGAPALLSPFEAPPEAASSYVSLSRRGDFIWPVRGQVISSYGPKAGGLYNDGINIAAPRGTPVKAAANGTVVYVGDKLQSYGNLVLIRHTGGMITAYAHLNSVSVRQGMQVTRGQTIGAVGSTGTVANAQLHFEVRRGKETIDPKSYLG